MIPHDVRSLAREASAAPAATFKRACVGSAYQAEHPCKVLLRFEAACHDGEIAAYAFDQTLDVICHGCL